MKKRMKQRLTSLAIGELAAVAVFWMNFFLFRKWMTAPGSLISVSFSLGILSFILIQASVFRWILLRRLSNPAFAVKNTGKVYKILKGFDLILLGAGVLVILLNSSTFTILFISVSIWMFAVIEWVNYYKLQLSYSLNPAVFLNYLLHGKLRKSKIAKEIDKTA